MTTPMSETPPTRWELLGNRNFVLLWCAYGVSALGDHLSEMAILKTQNAASSEVDVTPLDAKMTFLFFVPFFLLAPVTGWLADRLPRRGLMILADIARCGIMFFFLSLMLRMGGWGSWGPFLPLLLVGVFAAMFSPARSALLPTLIRPHQLVRANGMIAGLGVIATMVAIVLGGYLIDRNVSPSRVFHLDGLTFLASAGILWLLRAPPPVAPTDRGRGVTDAFHELVGGFRYALGHKRVLELLLIAALVWFCGPLVKCVIPAVVRDAYGYAENYQAMSMYRAFLGAGFILGAGVITLLGSALRSEVAITWGLLGIAASITLFAASVFAPVAGFARAVIGAIGVVSAGLFGVVVMASFNALLQRIVADRYRGRIFGIKDLCCAAALLVATGTLGVPQWSRLDAWVGYILLAVAGAMFAAWAINLSVRLRRGPHGIRLTFAVNLNEFLAKFWWRLKRIGPSTVPREGPVILTANHPTSADPLFLCASAPYRAIAFLVAEEYTHWPVASSFMRLVECIPVKRGTSDTFAIKQALRHLRAGKALGVFIEGRTVPPGEIVEPKDGVAVLALRTGAKVIPAHISGVTYSGGIVGGLLTRHQARVRFGPPVDLTDFATQRPGRECLRAASHRIFDAIHSLAPLEDPAVGSREYSGADRSSEPTNATV